MAPYVIHRGLAVYRFGNGMPLLFMPGPHRFEQPGHRHADILVDGLIRLRRQVITFDPPDSGNSTRPAQLGMTEMHGCASEALDACGVKSPVDALGHSMGGLVLLAYALQEPSRINRLVLVGTGSGEPAYSKSPGALWNRSHPYFWRMAALGILHLAWPALGPQIMMLNFIERHSFHNPALAEPDQIRWQDWLRPRRGRTDWHRIARRLNYAPRLREIRCSTLVLCGRFDPQFPPACSENLAASILHAQSTYFERSGHYPFVEEAKAFWGALDRFLSGQSSMCAVLD